jgi:peptidoglycan/xylan/chitin deacetylase (PgdA/CDA1 family)
MRQWTILTAAGGTLLAVASIGFAVGRFSVGDPAAPVTVAAKLPNPEEILTTAAIGTPQESRSARAPEGAKQSRLAAPALEPPAVAATSCKNPDALGVTRTVEIDTTGGPGLGLGQYKAYDFLQPGEVVLTFDDGPWPANTPAVLTALAAQCIKATFFPIGKHATWHPDLLKQVVAAGHTVGSHTWSHADLSKKTLAEAKDEIEKGISAVAMSAGQPLAPFFRFPALRQSAELTAYLGERNIATFSIDLDSLDFKIRKPGQVVVSVMGKLKKLGKGIILLHDFQHSTAEALSEILAQLKAGGFKIVHLKAKQTVETLPQYDALMTTTLTGRTADSRPTSAVIRTIPASGN